MGSRQEEPLRRRFSKETENRRKTTLTCPHAPFCYVSLNAGLSLEAKAVSALAHTGVALVRADFDLVERAVILAAAMIFTVADSAADVLVCKFCTHNQIFLS